MAQGAPTATARGTAGGSPIPDGYQSLVTFKLDATIELFEKTVTPPGVDGGDAIETTTMHNATWRTFAARGLKTLTEMTFVAAYDVAVYEAIISIINDDTEVVTVTWSDGDTLAFYGFLKMFEPGELSEGVQPEATVTVVPTNVDDTGAEFGPAYASG